MRHPPVVLAFLMQQEGWSLNQAYHAVQQRRPQIQPNAGFWKQLQAWQDHLSGLTTKPARFTELNSPLVASHMWFVTCRDLDGLSDQRNCWEWLRQAEKDSLTIRHVDALEKCVQFVLSRSSLRIDWEWLRCVCEQLDENNSDPNFSAIDKALEILRNQSSIHDGTTVGQTQIDQACRFLIQGM